MLARAVLGPRLTWRSLLRRLLHRRGEGGLIALKRQAGARRHDYSPPRFAVLCPARDCPQRVFPRARLSRRVLPWTLISLTPIACCIALADMPARTESITAAAEAIETAIGCAFVVGSGAGPAAAR